jgi:hypothetical protein
VSREKKKEKKKHPWPMETILLSICLEHEKMLGDALNKLKEKEAEAK